MPLDLNNIDAAGLAQIRFGVNKTEPFPGKQLTNLNDFNNFCFNTVAQFVDPNEIPLKHSSAGQKCQAAMLQQLALSGREHPGLKFRMPVVLSKPQYFKNAYLQTGNIDEAYKICVNSAIANQSPGLEQTNAIQRCTDARDALELTMMMEKNKQLSQQAHAANVLSQLNTKQKKRSSEAKELNEIAGQLDSNCASIVPCPDHITLAELDKKKVGTESVPSAAAVKSMTTADQNKTPNAAAYEAESYKETNDADDNDDNDDNADDADDDASQQNDPTPSPVPVPVYNNTNGKCGGIIIFIFLFVIIGLLISSICRTDDSGGGRKVAGQSQLKSQSNASMSSKMKNRFLRKR